MHNQRYINSAAMKIVIFIFILSLALVQGNEKKRISKLKCQEYNEFSKNNNICNEEPLISVVQLKDYPFVGTIGFDQRGGKSEFEWTCSGTLISDQFVLTTAHCTNNPRTKEAAKYVRLGSTSIDSHANAKIYYISEITRHTGFVPPSYYNDIALLKLDKPVNFTEYIQPACLYSDQDLPEYNIAGFSFFFDKIFEARRGHLLHQINAVVAKEECKEQWDKQLGEEVNFDIQLCTRTGHVTCDISSGAPLLHKDEELRCMQSVAGIVDLGNKELCNGKAALNVKISGFLDWIENIVWPKP